MNNTKKMLISSLASICLLGTVIAGATYAVFTSETSKNITVEAGEVNVKSTLSDLKTYCIDLENVYDVGVPLEDGSDTLISYFENGGNAKLNTIAGTVDIEKMTPGDEAVFTLNIENLSNVKTRYRVNILTSGKLAEVLEVSFTNLESGNVIESSEWVTLDPKNSAIEVNQVASLEGSIYFPFFASTNIDHNDYQGKTATVLVVVEAVQYNAFCNVDFYNGDDLLYTEIVKYNGTALYENALPTKEGYQFVSWGIKNENGELVEIALETYQFTNDTSVYAMFVERDQRLSFRLNDDLESYTVSVDHDIVGPSHINIPDYYNGLPVTVFESCSEGDCNIDTITLPNCLEVISKNAFKDSSLTKVEIPNSVIRIEAGAFENSSLTEVVFEEDSKLEYIGTNAFYNCSNLSSFVVPDTLVYYGPYDDNRTISPLNGTAVEYTEYDGVYYLGSETNPYHIAVKYVDQNIVVGSLHPDTKIVGPDAFSSFSNFGENFKLPDGLLTISGWGFSYSRLGELTIPSSVIFIDYDAFYGARLTSLTFEEEDSQVKNSQRSTLGETGLVIGGYAFANNYNLETVILPNHIKEISKTSFNYCDNIIYNEDDYGSYLPTSNNQYFALVSLKNDEVTTCNPNTQFIVNVGNTNVNKFVVPASVEKIVEEVFINNSNLTTVEFEAGSNLKSIGDNAFANTAISSITLPEGLEHIGTECFRKTKLVNVSIPSSVKHIGDRVFQACDLLESCKFGENMHFEYIGVGMFINCYKLKEFKVSNGFPGIKQNMFRNCSNLSKVTYEDGTELTFIDGRAFENCTSIESFVIPYTVTDLKQKAFYCCTNLSSVTFENDILNKKESNLLFIGNDTFNGCSKITTIDIPNSVMFIKQGAFQDCVELTTITLSDNLKNIADMAFSGCDKLEFVIDEGGKYLSSHDNQFSVYVGPTDDALNNTDHIINNDTEFILYDAFAGLSQITEINIPGNVRVIGQRAFQETGLTSVTIPSSVQVIKPYAFANLVTLEEVNFEDESNLQEIAKYAFTNNTKLKEITIPNSVIFIKEGAFINDTALEKVNFEDDSNLRFVGVSSFRNTGLVDVTLPESVTQIKSYAFAYNTQLKSVTVSEGTIKIGANAFRGLTLDELLLPSSIHKFNALAFTESEIDSVEYNGTIDSWVDNKYENIYSNPMAATTSHFYMLDENGDQYDLFNNDTIVIDSVKRINAYSLIGLPTIETLSVGENINVIEKSAFGLTGLVNVTLPFLGESRSCNYDSFNIMFNQVSSNLESVTITDVTKINRGFIENIPSVKYLTLPDELEYLGSDSLTGLSNLLYNEFDGQLYIPGETNETMVLVGTSKSIEDFSNIVVSENTKILYEIGSEETYLLVRDLYLQSNFEQITIDNYPYSYGNDFGIINEHLVNVYYDGTLEDWCNIEFGTNKINPMLYAEHFYCRENDTSTTWIEIKEELTIPESITEIGAYQFEGFDFLVTVNIHKDVTSIGDYAFAYDSNLQNFNIEEGSKLKHVGSTLFRENKVLDKVIIPEGVEKLNLLAFDTKINELYLPSTLKTSYNGLSHSDREYNQYTSHISKLYYNGTIQDWMNIYFGTNGDYDYSRYPNYAACASEFYCINPETGEYELFSGTIELEEGYKRIDSYSLRGIDVDTLILPKSIKEIQSIGTTDVIYYNGTAIDWVSIYFDGDGVMLDHLFVLDDEGNYYDFLDATELVIPSYVEYMPNGLSGFDTIIVEGDTAFINGVSNIKNLYLSADYSYGIYGFYNIENLYYGGSLNDLLMLSERDLRPFNSYYFNNIYYYDGEKYCEIDTSYVSVPEEMTYINSELFYGAVIDTLFIPKTVTRIESYSFDDASIKNIIFEEGSQMTTLSYSSFYGVEVENIVLPDNLEIIGDDALASISIDTLIIPNTVKIIRSKAFRYSRIGNLVLPTSITQEALDDESALIEYNAFENCYVVTLYNQGNLPLEIGSYDYGQVAMNAQFIEGIYVDDSDIEVSYPDDALVDSNNLVFIINDNSEYELIGYKGEEVSVTLPSKYVVSETEYYDYVINSNPFIGTSVKEVILKSATNDCVDGWTTIAENQFENWDTIKQLVVPSSVTSIGKSAFAGWSSLEKMTTPIIGTDSIGYYFGSDAYYNNDTYAPTSLAEIIVNNENLLTLPAYSFREFTNLRKVTIPGSVETIGSYAFDNCSKLETIKISGNDNVTRIESYAFNQCSSLGSVPFNNLTYIDDHSFYSCDRFCNIKLDKVTYIGSSAFGYTRLKEVNLENVIRIESSAFSSCYSLRSVGTPKVLEYIGNYAFGYCEELESFTLPSTMTSSSFGSNAFSSCYSLDVIYNLTELLIIPNSTTYGYVAYYADKVYNYQITEDTEFTIIDDFVFFDSSDKHFLYDYVGEGKEISIPLDYNGEEYFLINDFIKEREIEKVILPEGMTAIEANIFANCSSLKEVVISSTITSVSELAFTNCKDLIVYYNGTLVQWMGITFNTIKENPMYYSKDFYYYENDAYKKLEGELIIPDEFTQIGNYQFAGAIDITDLYLGNNVTSVGNGAFYGAKNIITVTIPQNVTSINNQAFRDCANIDVVYNLSDSITNSNYESAGPLASSGYVFGYNSICFNEYKQEEYLNVDDYLFVKLSENHYGLLRYEGTNDKLVLPTLENATYEILPRAFANSNISSLTIPNCVTKVGYSAFYSSKNLTEIIFEESEIMTEIGSYAFEFCSSVKEITLPSSLQTVKTGGLLTAEHYYYDGMTTPFSVEKLSAIKYYGSVLDWTNITFESRGYTYSYDGMDRSSTHCGNPMCRAQYFYYYLNNEFVELVGTLNIPLELTEISTSTYCGGYYILHINIYDNIITLPTNSFKNYPNLRDVNYYFDGTMDEYIEHVNTYGQFDAINEIDHFYYRSIDTNEYVEFDGNLVISDSITSVADYAFAGWNILTSVEISSSVETIGNGAFMNCKNLQSVTFEEPTSIGEGIKSLGASLFNGSTNVKEITLPTSIETLNGTFQGSSIKDVYYNGTFENWFNVDITNPSIKLPSSYSTTTHYGSPTRNGANLYYKDNDSYVKVSGTIVIPESVTVIKDNLFAGLKSITTVKLHSGVESIIGNAFYNCTSLYEVYNFSSTLTLTKGSSSNGYVACYAIVINTEEADSIFVESGDFTFVNKGTTESPSYELMIYNGGEETTLPLYYEDENGNQYDYTINPDAFTSVGNVKVTLSDDWTTINNNQFENIKGISELIIPNSVTTIGLYAFKNMSNLETLHLPSFDKSKYFYQYFKSSSYSSGMPSSLKTVVFTGDYETVSYNFFGNFWNSMSSYNSPITTIVFDGNIGKISANAFYNHGSATEIVFNGTIDTIASYAFEEGTFKKYTFNGDVGTLKENLFTDWYNSTVKEVYFNGRVEYLESYCFNEVDLTKLVFHDVGSIPSRISSYDGADYVFFLGKVDEYYEYLFESISYSKIVLSEHFTGVINIDYDSEIFYMGSSENIIFIGPEGENLKGYYAGEWEFDENGLPVPLA